jgi:hypothetical protein
MKKLAIVMSALLLLAGCDALFHPNPFVGTWIGYGELVEEDTPGDGDTRVTALDDVVTFHDDMTFELGQGLRQSVNGVITLTMYQKGTGTYDYTEAELTMMFDASSDPGLDDDTPSYVFSNGDDTCTIQPTTLTFPLVFERVK